LSANKSLELILLSLKAWDLIDFAIDANVGMSLNLLINASYELSNLVLARDYPFIESVNAIVDL